MPQHHDPMFLETTLKQKKKTLEHLYQQAGRDGRNWSVAINMLITEIREIEQQIKDATTAKTSRRSSARRSPSRSPSGRTRKASSRSPSGRRKGGSRKHNKKQPKTRSTKKSWTSLF
jgi:superfamily II DNA helicase RecQ